MAFTLAEANWLVRSGVTDDALVAYPTADRGALAELAADPQLAAAVTLMIDSTEQLDLIDGVCPPGSRPELRVCLDLDASWRPLRGRVHVGVRRSPVHSARAAGALAAAVGRRPGFRLVGLMSYEAQIAGLGDAPPGQAAAQRRDPDRPTRVVPGTAGPPGRGGGRRPANTPTWSSSTAAAPAAWPPPAPTPRSPRSPPDRGCTGRRCSTPTGPGGRSRRRSSPARWSVGRRRRSPPCSAAAGSPPVPPPRADCPGRGCRPGWSWSAPRARARCRPHSPAPPQPGCGSATGSGSATPRRANSANGSTNCTWSTGTRSSSTVPTYRGEGHAFL